MKNVKIHCWGGLGSQLYALSLAEDVSEIYPNKNIKIIFHSSGVTRRCIELRNIPARFQISFVDDFSYPNYRKRSIRRTKANNFYRKLLIITGLLATCDDDISVRKIKPWVLEIRGHYSYRKISLRTLEKIYGYLFLPEDLILNKDGIGLHYRLGDLLEKNIKSYIDGRVIVEIIRNNIDLQDQKVDLYSDTPDSALSMLKNSNFYGEIFNFDYDAIETIRLLTRYKFFIGTNSKITVWIVLFRILRDTYAYNFIPSTFQQQVVANLSFGNGSKNIVYY
jgi:hypothetical protein